MKKIFSTILAALGLLTLGLSLNVNAATVTDVLNSTVTGVSGTSYTEKTGLKSNSDAVYYYQGAGDAGTIQIRSKNSNSGIVTTASGGFARKITVVWSSKSSAGRTLDIYGASTAYTNATQLYNTVHGSKLGSIVNGTSTEFTISGDYAFIGMRSNNGAMYFDSISIEWEIPEANPDAEYQSVTFEANNGSEPYVKDNAVKGETISAPATPAKNFHSFVGWYKDEALTEAWDFENDVVNEDITLYAKWEAKEVLSISDALTQAKNSVVVTEGVVTYQTKYNYFWLQDDNAGILLYGSTGFKIGSTIRVEGTRDTYNGTEQLKNIVAYEEIDKDFNIVPHTSVDAVTSENLGERISLLNWTVPASLSFAWYYADADYLIGDKTVLTAGNVVNVEGIITTYNSNLQITVKSVSLVKPAVAVNFEASETKASLALVYADGVASNVDLRFGGVIAANAYNANAKYGVIVLAKADAAKLVDYTATTAAELAGDGYYVQCTPVAVDGGYQFAWVIDNVEGNEDFEFVAVMYMELNGKLYLAQVKEASVNSVAQHYVDNDAELEISAEVVEVLNNLLA